MTTKNSPPTVFSETPLIVCIKLHQVEPNPYQTRDLNQAKVQELRDDIKKHGVQQRPKGRWHPDKIHLCIQLAYGHHRLAACEELSVDNPERFGSIEIEVEDISDQRMSELAIVENAKRGDLTPVEKGRAMKAHMEHFKVSLKETAQLFNLSESGASNLMRLLQLPVPVQALVDDVHLPERLARSLVTASRVSPTGVEAIAKKIAKADPSAKQKVATFEITELYKRDGRPFERHVWPPQWPEKPIPLAKPVGDLAALPACKGCPFFVEYEGQTYCTNAVCYDAKLLAWARHEAERLSSKLGIALAQEDEKVVTFYDAHDWDYALKGRAERAALAKLPSLRLRPLLKCKNPHELEGVTGSRYVALMTTNKSEIERYLADGQKSKPDKKPTKLTPADRKKQAEREERKKAERRAARAKFLLAKFNTLWLIESTARLISARLTISGGVLAFAEDLAHRRYRVPGSQWPEFSVVESRLIKSIKSGKDEATRRQHIVLDVIGEELLGYHRPEDAYDWPHAQQRIEKIAAQKFGVKLPADWNKPPVHRTGFNCWSCGMFGTNPGGLTKREVAAGWGATYEGKILTSVKCPGCNKNGKAGSANKKRPAGQKDTGLTKAKAKR